MPNEDIPQDTIVQRLTTGLERLTIDFPWVAGQVVNHGADQGDSGLFKIVPFESLPRLEVKDLAKNDRLTGGIATMAELRATNFPSRLLDEDLFCPRKTMTNDEATKHAPKPVLLLQATFVVGGLLLSILASHSVMDIVGQVQITRYLSRACHDDKNLEFTPGEIADGNLERECLIPLLDKQEEKADEPEHEGLVNNQQTSRFSNSISPNTSVESTLLPPPSLIWASFICSSDSLSRLKSFASSSLAAGTTFISTDDALCALIWQGIGRARRSRLLPSTESIFTRAIDMRNLMGISPRYLGNMTSVIPRNFTLEQLCGQALGAIASSLRSDLNPESLRHGFKAHATSQARLKDKSVAKPKDRSQAVVMSSWSKTNCYDVDFNLGMGKPESVRRPRFEPIEGVVYLLPKAPDDEITVMLCLRDEDMTKLKQDQEFLKFAEYIG